MSHNFILLSGFVKVCPSLRECSMIPPSAIEPKKVVQALGPQNGAVRLRNTIWKWTPAMALTTPMFQTLQSMRTVERKQLFDSHEIS